MYCIFNESFYLIYLLPVVIFLRNDSYPNFFSGSVHYPYIVMSCFLFWFYFILSEVYKIDIRLLRQLLYNQISRDLYIHFGKYIQDKTNINPMCYLILISHLFCRTHKRHSACVHINNKSTNLIHFK